MCIRDSDGIEGLHHIDRVIDIDQLPIGRTPRSNPATYTGCLLYTSDAADERSSVDLGGRRIIKKKKTHRLQISPPH